MIQKNIAIKNKPIELNEQKQPIKTEKERAEEKNKATKSIVFCIKAVEDVLQKFILSQNKPENVEKFFTSNINLICELVCLESE